MLEKSRSIYFSLFFVFLSVLIFLNTFEEMLHLFLYFTETLINHDIQITKKWLFVCLSFILPFFHADSVFLKFFTLFNIELVRSSANLKESSRSLTKKVVLLQINTQGC